MQKLSDEYSAKMVCVQTADISMFSRALVHTERGLDSDTRLI